MVLAIILLISFVEYAGILRDTNDVPKGYFRDEIADTVEKVKKFETEPALVFLLCSDIHYMSVQGKRPVGYSAPFREINTATENLWDVLIIRPESKTINTIRFGAGEDREWTY